MALFDLFDYWRPYWWLQCTLYTCFPQPSVFKSAVKRHCTHLQVPISIIYSAGSSFGFLQDDCKIFSRLGLFPFSEKSTICRLYPFSSVLYHFLWTSFKIFSGQVLINWQSLLEKAGANAFVLMTALLSLKLERTIIKTNKIHSQLGISGFRNFGFRFLISQSWFHCWAAVIN